MTLSTRRARLLACAALALPALILGIPLLAGSRQPAAYDFQSGYAPLYEFCRRSWAQSGELPRWNPDLFTGVQFLGNPQVNLLYPPNWLFLAATSGRAYGILIVLHLLAASAGFYRLLRGLEASRSASVLGALSYSLSFTVMGRLFAGHYPYFVTLCLAPPLLHFLRLTIDRPSPRHAGGLAAATAGLLLGGSPQFTLHLALLSAAFASWRLLRRFRSPAPWRPSLAAVSAALGIGVLVSLAHLVPSLDLAGQSSRATGDVRSLSDLYVDFPLSTLSSFFVPRFHWRPEFDPWLWHEKALYAGLLPLALAGVALTLAPRGPVRLFAVAGLLALLAAAGPALLVHRVLSLLPFYALFRVPERIAWIAVLAVSAMSAFGWDLLKAAEPGRRRRVLLIGAAIAVALALAVWVGPRAPREAAVLLVTAAAGLGAVALVPRSPWATVAALGVLAADLGGHALATLSFVSATATIPAPWYESRIGAQRAEYRLADLTDIRIGPALHGFRLLRCGGYPIPGRLAGTFSRAWEDPKPDLDTLPTGTVLRDPDLFRRLNVRWIVTPGDALSPGWNLLARTHEAALYENPDAVPVARLEGTEGSVTWSRPSPHRIRLEVNAGSSGRVRLNESWAAGWSASRNSAGLPLRADEDGLMDLEVPAGPGTIDLVFTPRYRTAVNLLSGLGLLALLAGIVAGGRRPAPGP